MAQALGGSSPAASPLAGAAPGLLLAAAALLLAAWLRGRRPRAPPGLRSPPGPRGWPLLGHALSLGRRPHEALAALSRRHGPVLQLRLGRAAVVVLGGADAVRQALLRQGDAFRGRPALPSLALVGGGRSLAFSPDAGPVWAARRRLAQAALRSWAPGAGAGPAALEELVGREARGLARTFRGLTARAGRFDPHEHLVLAVARVIGAMCFGENCPRDGDMVGLLRSSQAFAEGAAAGNAADFFPVLRYLPNPGLQRFKAFNRRFTDFLQKAVQEHFRDYDRNHVQDITSALFLHAEKEAKAEGVPIPREDIVNIVNDIFGAGFDTVTTAISWCLMYLVSRPDVQRSVHKELDEVIGERPPRLSDRPQLPYLEAFILEVFRHSSFVPFTIPHSTTKDTTLNGFYIPKDRCIFINQWQINHDLETWGDPSEFRPERFLTDGGTALNKALGEKVMLFGLGKRRCIGENLARWEVFLFLATLLQGLHLSLTPGVEPDLTPIYGLTMRHARCPHFQAQPHSAQGARPGHSHSAQ